MDDETLAALEAAESALTIFEDARSARLIRALIEQERSGGALAKVITYQRGFGPGDSYVIASGAHEEQP